MSLVGGLGFPVQEEADEELYPRRRLLHRGGHLVGRLDPRGRHTQLWASWSKRIAGLPRSNETGSEWWRAALPPVRSRSARAAGRSGCCRRRTSRRCRSARPSTSPGSCTSSAVAREADHRLSGMASLTPIAPGKPTPSEPPRVREVVAGGPAAGGGRARATRSAPRRRSTTSVRHLLRELGHEDRRVHRRVAVEQRIALRVRGELASLLLAQLAGPPPAASAARASDAARALRQQAAASRAGRRQADVDGEVLGDLVRVELDMHDSRPVRRRPPARGRPRGRRTSRRSARRRPAR